jgi:hypothetical protein
VSAYYDEIERFRPYVYFYKDEKEYFELLSQFTAGIVQNKYTETMQSDFLLENTWDARYAQLYEMIER